MSEDKRRQEITDAFIGIQGKTRSGKKTNKIFYEEVKQEVKQKKTGL